MRRAVGLISLAVLAMVTSLGPFQGARAAWSSLSITLTPSQPSPQPVETPITWSVTASNATSVVYQFSVATSPAGPFTVQRDFSPHMNFVWAPIDEGTYYIQVTAKQGYTGTATSSTVVSFVVTSRVSTGQPVVTSTANPLVALYSAPPCSAGTIQVKFQSVRAQQWLGTNTEQCESGQSRNFLVAGMLPKTTYRLVNVVSGTSTVTSTPLQFTTGSLPPLNFPRYTVPVPPQAGTDLMAGTIFHTENPMVATNLQGRIVWYDGAQDRSQQAFRIEPISGDQGVEVLTAENDGLQQGGDDILRTVDLLGNPLQETNVQAINAQLQARGQEIIYGFHHDALVLPNGNTAVLAHTYQVITTTLVLGLMLVVLDRNFQVTWTWDAFHFLNPFRGPTLGETCADDPPHYCPAPGGPNTIDWLHGNAISWSPLDQNLTLSLRHQDWVIKIAYNNGAGDGTVLWRLGVGGDFTIVPLNPRDPYPWFSHQHDANYLDGTTMTLFDNGNTRCATLPPPCDSRGQTYTLDEQSKVATQTLNADLGNYSAAFGIAQRLSNGNYAFSSGIQTNPLPPFAQDIEVRPDGTKTYVQQANTTEYRAWRLMTLYSPTNQP